MNPSLRTSLFILLISLLLGAYFLTLNRNIAHHQATDFASFYESVLHAKAGENIYKPIPFHKYQLPPAFERLRKQKHRRYSSNLNPPIVTGLLWPLGSLSYGMSLRLWVLFSMICGALGGYCLVYVYAREKIPWLFPVILIVLLGYFPTYVNGLFGQFGLVMMGLLCLGWASARAGHDHAAGICFGIAFSIKLFFGLFLWLFVLKRRWRIVSWMVRLYAVSLILSVGVFGQPILKTYYQVLHGITWHAANWNGSLLGFISRVGKFYPFSVSLIYGASALVVTGIMTWMLSRPTADDVTELDWQVGVVTISMLLLSPLGWLYYFPLLFLPAAIVLHIIAQSPTRIGAALLCALGAALFLSNTIQHYVPADLIKSPIKVFTIYASPFYSLLIFWVLFCGIYLLRRSQKVPVRAPILKQPWQDLLLPFAGLLLCPSWVFMIRAT